MTEAAKIHTAMEAAGGSLRRAARALGVDSLVLKDAINSDPALRARWRTAGEAEKGVPGDAETLHRPATDVVTVGKDKLTLEEGRKIADAVAAEDAAIRNGLLNMGVKASGLNMVMAMQTVQRKHFARCIEILGGGITKQAIDVMLEIDRISERLSQADVPMDEQFMLRMDRRGLLDILGRFKDKVDKSALIQAQVKKLEADAKAGNGGGRNKPGKPGFGTLLVKGETVEIHEHHEHAPPE